MTRDGQATASLKHLAYSEGGSELKPIIGIGLCITGTVIWAAALRRIYHHKSHSPILGVVIGGGITASGIILFCVPNKPIRFSYFDKR